MVPCLQILVSTDQMEPIISATVPHSAREHDPQKLFRFLVGRNTILQNSYFIMEHHEEMAEGMRYKFRTCQSVVNYIAKREFCLPTINDWVIFDTTIAGGLPSVGLTKVIAAPPTTATSKGA